MQTTIKITTKNLVLVGLVTAITCIIAPFVIPLPFSPVPITFGTLILYFSTFILGTRLAALSCFVYLLLGFAGLPVFSGFTGGFGKLAGPTGGYLIGYIFLIVISGLFIEYFQANPLWAIIGMILGTAVLYCFGTVWLCLQLEVSFWQGLSIGALPYLLGDGMKIIIAALAGPTLRKRLLQIQD